MAPSICCREPSGLTTTPLVLSADHALHAHSSGASIDRHFGHRRHPRTQINSARDARAPAARSFARFPAETLRGGFEYAPHARVGQVVEPELERVHAGLHRQRVDVRFARERVGVDRRSAPRPRGERVHALLAAPVAGGDRALVGHVVELLRLPVARGDHVKIPESDFSGGGEPGADLHHRRRTERVEEELLAAVPDHLHRLAGDPGQPRRLDRLPGGALAAESTAHIRRHDADVAGLHTERLGHLKPHRERRLRAGPDGRFAVLDHRRRGMGLHGRMRDVAVQIRLLLDRAREFLALAQVAGLGDDLPGGARSSSSGRRSSGRWSPAAASRTAPSPGSARDRPDRGVRAARPPYRRRAPPARRRSSPPPRYPRFRPRPRAREAAPAWRAADPAGGNRPRISRAR